MSKKYKRLGDQQLSYLLFYLKEFKIVIGKELSSTTIEKHNIYYSTNNKSKLNYYRAINPKLCE